MAKTAEVRLRVRGAVATVKGIPLAKVKAETLIQDIFAPAVMKELKLQDEADLCRMPNLTVAFLVDQICKSS